MGSWHFELTGNLCCALPGVSRFFIFYFFKKEDSMVCISGPGIKVGKWVEHA